MRHDISKWKRALNVVAYRLIQSEGETLEGYFPPPQRLRWSLVESWAPSSLFCCKEPGKIALKK